MDQSEAKYIMPDKKINLVIVESEGKLYQFVSWVPMDYGDAMVAIPLTEEQKAKLSEIIDVNNTTIPSPEGEEKTLGDVI